MPTPELKVKLLLVTQQFEESADKAEKAVDDLGAACEEAAGKVGEVSDAIEDVKAGTDSAAESTDRFAGSIDRAKGGLDVIDGAAAIASGSIGGIASGAMKAAEGLKKIGLSAVAFRTQMLAVGAVASTIMLVVTLIKEAAEEAAQLDRIRLDNLLASARSVGDEFARASDRINRANELADKMKGIGSEEQEIRQRIALANLDAQRDRELAAARAAGGGEDAVARLYAARRRDMEYGFERGREGNRVGSLQDQIAKSQERRGAIDNQIGELTREFRRLTGQGSEYYRQAESTVWTEKAGDLVGKGDEAMRAAQEVARQIQALGAEMKLLEDAEKVYARQIESSGLRIAEIDAREAADRASAELAAASSPETNGKKEDEDAVASGISASASALSDRLARIGGYTGDGYSSSAAMRDQLNATKQGNQILQAIERKISFPFSAQIAVLG